MKGKPLSEMTLFNLKELGIETGPQGFRSPFGNWAREQTAHQHEVIEFALAHVMRDKTEAAYAQFDRSEKWRTSMDDRCSYLKSKLKRRISGSILIN